MLNVHFCCDLVRCPDIRASQLRRAELNEKEKRCKYGIEECKCYKWFDYCNNRPEIMPLSKYGRCFLSGSEFCPFHQERKTNGLMKKTFKIGPTQYRQCKSSMHYLIKTSPYDTLFITLTFPPFKKYCNDKKINQLFSQYVENLRKRYDCTGYIAVRENGSQHGRVHFHLVISIPFVPFDKLNNIWCNTLQDYCDFSKNALQTDKKTRVIKNPIRAVKYICKYFAKCRDQVSETRLIFISNNIIIGPKQFDNKNCEFFTLNDIFDKYKSISVYGTSDYSTLFRINDALELEQFCNEYLYKIFNLPEKNAVFYALNKCA